MASYLATNASRNAKTGPMLVTTSPKQTCPTSCPLRGNGCYAESGPLGMIWRSMSESEPGQAFQNGRGTVTPLSWEQMLERVRRVPSGYLWRHNQAGDLPGDGNEIDTARLRELVDANRGRRGFTYTHHAPTEHNLAAIKYANDNGFTVNMSADSLAEADRLFETGAGPVVTVLPADQTENLTTPAGRSVVVCPAYTSSRTCVECQLCTRQRNTIVGFPAHGARRKRVESVYNLEMST